MNEIEVLFETAKLAKSKEFFDKNIYGSVRLSQPKFYNEKGVKYDIKQAFELETLNLKECYNAPTQSILQKWLRIKHKIDVIPTFSEFSRTYGYKIFYIENGKTVCINNMYIKKESYEDAFELGLLEGLKLIPNEKV